MLHSMTGYGAATAHIEGVDYTVEMRSLNNRYFKASIKLPEAWSGAEADVEKLLRERLGRGSVNFALRMRMGDESAAYTVNAAALRRYVEQARAALGDGVRLDVGGLLALPGVCVPPETGDIVERCWPALRDAVEQAMDRLVDMRAREGQGLLDDLAKHCQVIEEQLKTVEDRKLTVVADYHQRLLARVNELTQAAQLKVSENDLIREVAVFAERADISEEISRLRSHLEQFRRICAAEESGGRKLDFISQEMLREANTIGSKANDAQIARAIVEIKASIDRIKEQVQNVA